MGDKVDITAHPPIVEAELTSLKALSFRDYLKSELRRGYLLENDEERYTARREKVYTFFKIPREIEKFVAYGFFQCADSFFFVFTFLPVRFTLAIWSLLTRPFRKVFGLYFSKNRRILKPAEIVDLLKGVMVLVCCYLMGYIDTSVCYHIIKTQSTIKLYLFFNMLEIADRLMSAFGQDTLDALFWTATEPRGRKREHFGVLFHLLVAIAYVALHSTIVLLQALTLNVAINSDNKGLLTIVISNNFVELKGAVFKKFDRNNLLQISCSDVRERFHNCVLLLVVVIQTMKEYAWKEERLWILLPDCLLVCGTEILVDWLKHAFITRFNDIPADAYKDYTVLLASDLIMCKQKYAYSDHSDLVARRMGFIPLPLGVVMYRILSQSIRLTSPASYLVLGVGFLCLLSFRMSHAWVAAVVMVVALGGGCEGFSIRPELAGLLKAEEIHKQFELLEILLGKLVNGSNCRNRTQDAAEETTEIEPEGEGTTMAPESEEEVEDEKEKNKDYEKLHQNHTMLLPPNADCNVTKTGITDEEKDFILELHNDLRSYVAYGNESQGDPGPQPPAANMHQLVWNEELAEVAQAWASQCPSGHDEEKKRRLLSRKYHTGQNINYYWGTDDNGSDWEKAIKNWYNEVMDVDAKIAAAFIPHNTKKIGHYTQLIWGNTKEIGCGIVYYATERKGFYFPYSITYVCNYGPSGNFINMPFYEHGPAATKCPGKVSTEYSALCA